LSCFIFSLPCCALFTVENIERSKVVKNEKGENFPENLRVNLWNFFTQLNLDMLYFLKEPSMIKKDNSSKNNPMFQCIKCEKQFFTRINFSRHLMQFKKCLETYVTKTGRFSSDKSTVLIKATRFPESSGNYYIKNFIY